MMYGFIWNLIWTIIHVVTYATLTLITILLPAVFCIVFILLSCTVFQSRDCLTYFFFFLWCVSLWNFFRQIDILFVQFLFFQCLFRSWTIIHSVSEFQLILCNGNCIDDLMINCFPECVINSGLNLYHMFLKFDICPRYYKKSSQIKQSF